MRLTRAILDNPIAGYSGLFLVVLFGAVALDKLPIQLTPEIEEPTISITTTWRAASPEEIEAEIIVPQEEALKGVPGLKKMLSESREGSGVLYLTFGADVDTARALIDVVNRLNTVPDYPVDANEPSLSNVGERTRPIAWFIIRPTDDNTRDILSYRRYVEEIVQNRFERVSGVALSEVRGTMPTELRISVDPYKTAGHGVALPEAARRLAGQDDVSGGKVEVGKRDYRIRFHGAYTAETFANLVIEWRDGEPVRLGDIAEIEMLPTDQNTFVLTKDGRSIAVNAYRETGVNVLRVMSDLQTAADELTETLARRGLQMQQVYDETLYIRDAIRLLFGNLLVGILLAGGVLYWFTRRVRTTLVVAMSVPISLFAAFVMLQLTGRTLNTISLSAMALSVGMILDASIIVVENILRLRASGESLLSAAFKGVEQIKNALIASTVTSVAIFLPIVWMEDEAGQLFADLAIGLAVAVSVSLLAALFLTPSLANRWIGKDNIVDPFKNGWDKLTVALMRSTSTGPRRATIIALSFAVPVLLISLFLPRVDYLPQGSRNLVFAVMLPPPGMNVTTIEKEFGNVLARRMEPHVKEGKFPEIQHYFFVVFSGGAFMGARAKHAEDAGAMVPVINSMMRDFPGVIAFARQASLFSRGDTRTVEMNIQGRDIGRLLRHAFVAHGAISAALPGVRIQPRPGLELAESELSLLPNEERIAEVGWERNSVGLLVRAVGDGLFVDDFFDGFENVDVVLRMGGWNSPEEMAALPMQTPRGGVVPLGELVDIRRTAGPESIRRIDRHRTLSLDVIAPPNLSLQDTLQILREQVEPALRQNLAPEERITYGGSASKLGVALSNMSEVFVLALLILYFLMAALFRSFIDPLLVVLMLPLALVGSVLALKLVELFLFQPMDLLTMMGFVIMLGLVVNNAILLVYQTRQGERDGLARSDAVAQALRIRLRPIFMSTLTSLLGMMPLLFALGAGSELYRGLAAVIVGGLSVSTIFTLMLLPAMLRIGESGAPTVARQHEAPA